MEIITWLVSQLLMIIYIRFASWHHAPAVNAMRSYVPTPNPYDDPFHEYAWLQAAVVAVIISSGLLFYHSLWWCIGSGILSAAWYWLLFDPWVNKGTGKSWDYLGNSSTLDIWLTGKFGKRGGEIKAILMAVLIILINIIKLV